ncbi:RHS repeat-associated core domain-containing protein, partial [Nocardioides sp. NPDC057764]
LGRQKTITKGNGNVTTNAFQSDGALKSMREETSAGALVASHGYTYDANGNQLEDVASKKNADDASATLDSTTTYVYDPVDRLKGKTKTGHAASSETYVHDANANVIQQTVGGTSTSFNYDRNRLLSSTVDGQTASYRYDPFGRQTSVVGGGKTISRTTYDGFDHIKVAEKANDAGVLEATTYTYDPLDRTASKTTSGTDGKTTDYTYLGLSQEVLGEEVAGELTKSYQYSPWGQRLSQITHQADAEAGVVAGETGYYGYNAHTDVETVTDDTGKTVATYGYTAYGENDEAEFTGIDKPEAGNPEQPSDESFNAYRFNGKRWDAGSGTYDMGFRDYNPGLNTFTTRDMYNGALADMGLGIDPYSGSRYAFTAGNPISRIELDGHQFDAATGGGGNEATSSSACYPGSAGCGEPTSGPPKRDPYADVPVKCDHTGERCGNVAGFGDGLTIDGPTYEESQQNVLLAYILAAGAAACAVAPQGCAALALESVPGAEGVAAASAGAGALGLWRLLSRESGGAATGAAGHADHIVLGLESGDDLEKFASAVGGRTLMSDRNWKGTVWTASEVIAEDPSYVKISFSLDGMDGVENGVESVVGNSLLRDSRQIGGATDLEIAYLKQNDALQYVDFYIGGELQPNPFS